jgi:hypothetical protein
MQYIQCNRAAHSRTDCCCEKVTNISYSECVSVALGIERVNCIRHIVIGGLPCSTIFFHITSKKGTIFGKTLLNTKCVFGVSLRLLSGTFLSLTRIKRDITINVYKSSAALEV